MGAPGRTMQRATAPVSLAAVCALLAVTAGCGGTTGAVAAGSRDDGASGSPTSASSTTLASTTSSGPLPPVTTTSTTSTTTTPTTTAPIPTTTPTTTAPTAPTSTTAAPTTTVRPTPAFTALRAAVPKLAGHNIAAAVSVWRDGHQVFAWASGQRADGEPATTDSPFVIASVSKLVTALTVSRLVADGRITPTDPVPWTDMGVAHDPAWNDVTVRELLAHTSGLPVNRQSWLNDPGSCRAPLEAALAAPPLPSRGTWTYSNGNYCALGLLIERLTGAGIDEAANTLVFGPIGVEGPYLSTEGLRPTSVVYAKGLARLERLGGAGQWLASADDLAAMLTAVTPADREVLQWPGVILDQYGWGHTGTVDGAKACAWVLDEGTPKDPTDDTIVVGLVSGSSPSTGGGVCDIVETAVAVDLGLAAGDPVRNPL